MRHTGIVSFEFGGENVPSILGACATRKFWYLVRGPSDPTNRFFMRLLFPCSSSVTPKLDREATDGVEVNDVRLHSVGQTHSVLFFSYAAAKATWLISACNLSHDLLPQFCCVSMSWDTLHALKSLLCFVVVLQNCFIHTGASIIVALGPFYLYRLTLIPAWMSNYIYYKIWDDITYPLPNFYGATD